MCLCVCECLHLHLCVTVAETVAMGCKVTVRCHGNRAEGSALYGQGGSKQLLLHLFKQSTRRRRGGWMKQGISSPPPLPPPLCSLSQSLHMFQSSQVAVFYTNISVTASGLSGMEEKISSSIILLGRIV